MQQIERVGVVALLFLIVTIVVVAFWDDGREPESTRVADRDARRGQPSVEERVRADERGLRDDGRVAPRGERDRLTAVIGGDDGAIPRPRAGASNPERADRIGRNAEARQARQREREREAAEQGAHRGAGQIPSIELSRGRNQAEEERLYRRGLMNAPTGPEPAPHLAGPANLQGGELGSRKTKPGPVSTPSAGETWVVQSGETLERIARRALGDGRRWPEIAQLNGIENPSKIFVGQELQLPGGAAQAPPRVASADAPSNPIATPATPPVGGTEYVVKKGDMLSVIAQRQLGSAKRWKEIVALNPKIDPNRLHVGARLRMPAGAQAPSRPAESRLVAQAGESNFRVR